MRILSVTAQKPDSTGSGVYLSELVKGFDKLGCRQAVVCGTTQEDVLSFPEHISLFPVYYNTPELPFPVCGMSDEMPYASTRYRDLSEAMTRQLVTAFRKKIKMAVEAFCPDVILCHHLYFLAALVRQMYPNIPVYGQCHGSDLRQLATNPWEADWIRSEIRKLDGIFALHQQQKQQICSLFHVPEALAQVVGTGYNSDVFFVDESCKKARGKEKIRYIFAGKLSEKKGVYSLLRCLEHLPHPEGVEVYLAGGCGSQEELDQIRSLAGSAPCSVTFLGRLEQKALAKHMNCSDIFVLPSFYEGLPLVLIEAMACGLKTVCTDLPGIREWLEGAVPACGTVFVAPPRMRNTDEPVSEDLPAFELRLAGAMETAKKQDFPDPGQVKRLSWDALCQRILSEFLLIRR